MVQFIVEGMSCGHCVRAITKAAQQVDPAAQVQVELGSKRVSIDSIAEPDALAASIEEAGYSVARQEA